MKKLVLASLFVAMAATVIVNGCKHEPIILPTGNKPPDTTGGGGGDTTGTGHPCSQDSVYFVNDILPLIVSSCAKSGCHDAATHREDIVLTDYSHIMEFVTPFNPSNSRLYTSVNGGNEDRMPPPPNAPLTQDQINLIYKWIEQGALNNYCDAGCDTLNVTFSGTISPLVNTYCKGCHSGSSPGGGIDLTSFTGVQSVALNGKLDGAIHGAAGYFIMPPSGALSDCQIREIDIWIAAGAPNN